MGIGEAIDYLKREKDYCITTDRDGKWHIQEIRLQLDAVVTDTELIEHAQLVRSVDEVRTFYRIAR